MDFLSKQFPVRLVFLFFIVRAGSGTRWLLRLFLPLGIPDTIPFAILNLIRISSKELHPRKSHRSLIQCYSRSGAESFTGKALTTSLSLRSASLGELLVELLFFHLV